MRRQEGPLGKLANLANLAKMGNWSKSPTTWGPMQMRRPEGPLGKFGEFCESSKNGKLVKIADNLEANAHEKTRGPTWKASK